MEEDTCSRELVEVAWAVVPGLMALIVSKLGLSTQRKLCSDIVLPWFLFHIISPTITDQESQAEALVPNL